MSHDLDSQAFKGLGRLCVDAAENRIISAPDPAGMERIEARFHGSAFDLHRHDTYAIGVTLHGVQTFRYLGAARHSLPGQIIVLHPDELHDGGAGTEDGLRYRMLYLEPSLMLDCLGGASLPFVRDGVVADAAFCATLLSALGPLEQELDELFVDDFLTQLMQSLIRHGGQSAKPMSRTAWRAAALARDYLTENLNRPVRSGELEAVTGLDRYALSRHFRAAFSTSPHRFLVMRRLQRARRMIAAGEPLAQIAVEAGFSDQSHFIRQFKKAFGMTPGRWSSLIQGSAAAA
ncbi:MAG: helix-turn-helix domain-containing protein [Mesorhizobium sp.]|uniref:AraC family transcriptional regulator n=1 Tax=unclassified Mesorhizobium TaxID=325217 RepID=UPI000FCB4631|nr:MULTISPECIES: AraC family transcriptional regulator [unclassified Mesorhizobium]AZV18419.1 AraC family transcriptional regulator [Mesorhizobium sp. M7A.F.Ce.TU.012.03.2.1]RUU90926.1 AraC family transcriptional regulator [Mesorhizobium sp. M7A.F.Ca.MR.176.00.0.0]RVD65667.1 AraC family transcriptional regulator [Mesorhizobium sp. M7A.F.Ca.ET.027.03.2.1]RWP86406.1 MAG: AraC family transcriptional regulator [Mesorhizobium sp.]TIM23009.1 MAG: helix-turn-helix domain-containing protein [Mesorhizo